MIGYISAKEAATRWNVTSRQVQRMCAAGKMPGAVLFSDSWAIPEDTVKPTRTGKLKPGPKPKAKAPSEQTASNEGEHHERIESKRIQIV
jgi:hypothetical protein